jgi:hypothetical protein
MSKALTPEAKVAAAAGPQNVKTVQSTTQTNVKVAQAAAGSGVKVRPTSRKK